MKKTRLFLLHFAGGNAYSFQFLTSLLPGFEVIPLELPGRGRRIKEPLLNNFEAAAEDLYNQVLQKSTDAHCLIYGHSMGAYLALKVAGMLENINRNPAYVFVSGNAGPGVKEHKHTYLLEDEAFIEEVQKLGGLPTELIAHKELLEFFLPILRADFEIVANNNLETQPAINAPIYAIMGSQEEQVAAISNWNRYTRSHFNSKILEGGHFFIYEHAQQIADIIKNSYTHVGLLEPQ